MNQQALIQEAEIQWFEPIYLRFIPVGYPVTMGV